MKYLKITAMLVVLGLAGCGMGRGDTPPPEVNLETEEIVITIGEEFIPEDEGPIDSFLELEP
jgi:hypothetical protein